MNCNLLRQKLHVHQRAGGVIVLDYSGCFRSTPDDLGLILGALAYYPRASALRHMAMGVSESTCNSLCCAM